MTSDKIDIAEPRPSLGEEIANSASHAIGLVLALVAAPMLLAQAVRNGKPWGTLSAGVFVATIIMMYLASTLYHALPQGRAKRVLRTLEHCAIFLLIAGTYTPITLLSLRGAWGWGLLGLVWCLAGIGIAIKSMATTNHRWLPGLLYLALAWLILIAIRPLTQQLPAAGIYWLLWGGLAYTIGMAFFAARQVPYCHFVWHLFVLVGTACHFNAVWRYVV